MTDFAELAKNITTTDTPFLSNIQRGKATHPHHTWMSSTSAATDMMFDNYCQISVKLTEVKKESFFRRLITWIWNSLTSFRIAPFFATQTSLMAYQVLKMTRELKRDIECSLLSDNEMCAGSSTQPRVSRGLGSWLTTNVVQASAFTEDSLKELLQMVFTSGGDLSKCTVMMTPHNWALYISFGDNDAVDVSGFREIPVIANRFMDEDRVYLIDPSLCEIAYLRPFTTQPVVMPTNDVTRTAILAEWTLKIRDEYKMGQIRLPTVPGSRTLNAKLEGAIFVADEGPGPPSKGEIFSGELIKNLKEFQKVNGSLDTAKVKALAKEWNNGDLESLKALLKK